MSAVLRQLLIGAALALLVAGPAAAGTISVGLSLTPGR
jgi:hypothetical protein